MKTITPEIIAARMAAHIRDVGKEAQDRANQSFRSGQGTAVQTLQYHTIPEVQDILRAASLATHTLDKEPLVAAPPKKAFETNTSWGQRFFKPKTNTGEDKKNAQVLDNKEKTPTYRK